MTLLVIIFIIMFTGILVWYLSRRNTLPHRQASLPPKLYEEPKPPMTVTPVNPPAIPQQPTNSIHS